MAATAIATVVLVPLALYATGTLVLGVAAALAFSRNVFFCTSGDPQASGNANSNGATPSNGGPDKVLSLAAIDVLRTLEY